MEEINGASAKIVGLSNHILNHWNLIHPVGSSIGYVTDGGVLAEAKIMAPAKEVNNVRCANISLAGSTTWICLDRLITWPKHYTKEGT